MFLTKKKFHHILPAIFTPIYFTTSGVFIAEVGESGLHLGMTGLVFPLVFFLGIVFFLYTLKHILATKSVNMEIINNKMILLFFMIGSFLIILTLIGILLTNDLGGIIKLGQYLTGGIGIIVSIYLFSIKKMDPSYFFGKLVILYTVIIIIHYLTSIILFGLNPISGSVYPSVLGAGIYQSRVYYPYLVTMIFFAGFPYLTNRFHKYTFLFYILFLFYVFTLQVRGAMISFLVISVLVLVFSLKAKAKYYAFFVIFFFLILFNIFVENIESLGRIGEIEKIKDLNGRTIMWIEVFKNLSIENIFVGSFFNDIDHISAHNQYFEFITLSGFIPLTMLGFVGLLAIKIFLDSYKYNDNTLRVFSLLIFSTLIIDMNINVPLTNTNPAIHYWFIWSGIYFYYIQVKKKAGLRSDF